MKFKIMALFTLACTMSGAIYGAGAAAEAAAGGGARGVVNVSADFDLQAAEKELQELKEERMSQERRALEAQRSHDNYYIELKQTGRDLLPNEVQDLRDRKIFMNIENGLLEKAKKAIRDMQLRIDAARKAAEEAKPAMITEEKKAELRQSYEVELEKALADVDRAQAEMDRAQAKVAKFVRLLDELRP